MGNLLASLLAICITAFTAIVIALVRRKRKAARIAAYAIWFLVLASGFMVMVKVATVE